MQLITIIASLARIVDSSDIYMKQGHKIKVDPEGHSLNQEKCFVVPTIVEIHMRDAAQPASSAPSAMCNSNQFLQVIPYPYPYPSPHPENDASRSH